MRLRVAATAIASLAIVAAWYGWVIHPGIGTISAGRVTLLSPEYLALLAGLPLVWLGRSLSLTDMAPLQTALSSVTRSLLVIVIALALCRPTSASYSNRLSVAFVVDTSDSVGDEQLRAAQEFVDEARKAQGDHVASVVTFARRPRVVSPNEEGRWVLERPSEGNDGTDIEAALQLSNALFEPGTVPRVVLLTDGRETRGSAFSEAERFARDAVRIDSWVLPERKQPEVLVRRLTLPRQITVGRPFEVVVEVASSQPATGTLKLYQDELPNPLEPLKKVELDSGTKELRFRSIVRQSGHVSFKVELAVEGGDSYAENNIQLAGVAVAGKPRVLVCEGEPQRALAFKRALERESIDVELRGPSSVPTSLKELERYDLVVLSDVAPVFLGPRQVQAIETYVRDLGGGLLFAAGPTSFGSSGLAGSRIEALLPVRFDAERKRDQPVLAMMLIIDKSGSMAGHKIELAKEAARATAQLLSASDLIGVVAFDSQPLSLVRLQRAAARSRILGDIDRLMAGGGTSILPALQEGYLQLQPARAKVKHVILLSDGQSAYHGIAELVDEMAQQQITISTVGVGDGADRTLLAQIAEWGAGRFYFTQDASSVPKIFVKETTEVARSALVEELVRVLPVKQSTVLAGIDFESAPPLRGYVTTKPKRLGEVLLVSQNGEPLLARWRVGLGKVTAWTSDLKPRWSAPWMDWPGFSKFWAQAARDVMRARAARRFDLHSESEGGDLRIRIDAVDRTDQFVDGLSGKVQVIHPSKPGAKRELALTQTGPGRYEAELSGGESGMVFLRAQLVKDGSPVGEASGSATVGFAAEYAELTADLELAGRLAAITGGHAVVSPREVFDARGQQVRFQRGLWTMLLATAIALLLLDVLLRRVRLVGRKAVSTGRAY